MLMPWVVAAISGRPSTSFAQAIITIDPSIQHQVMTGWEAGATIGEVDFIATFESWQDETLDAAVDLNINRLRLVVNSGAENPVDYFLQYKQGLISLQQYNSRRNVAINDNGDPNAIDPAGFHFSLTDHKIDHVVTPLRQRLSARGKALHVMLQFQDASDANANPFEHSGDPMEYAEFVLAAYQHIQSKYGWVPDSFSIQNEPNNRGFWTPTNLGKALAATGTRLVAAGFPKPNLVAPDCEGTNSSLKFFDGMIAIPGVTTYLTDFSYHRYQAQADELQKIAARAATHGLRTGQLEHIGSSYEDLHEDLTLVGNSSWEQNTLAYPCGAGCGGDNGAHYITIDRTDPGNPRPLIGMRTKFLRQYFKFVDIGAVRVDARSDTSGFDPVAFVNPHGGSVVVIKATGGGAFVVRGLPAGTYGIKYTTGNEYDVDEADAPIGSGASLSATIPVAGVITVYGKGPAPTASSTATQASTATQTRTATRTRTRTVTCTRTASPAPTITEAATPTSIVTVSRTAEPTTPTGTPRSDHGDLTGDGRVTTDDLTALIEALFGSSASAAADVNDDDTISSADIVLLTQLVERPGCGTAAALAEQVSPGHA